MPRSVVNFGGNVRFTPRHLYAPTTEAEVLAILDRHADGKVRVVGALHSWNPAIACDDAIVDLRHFNAVEVERGADGAVWATVGGGCRIKHLIRKLYSLARVTMPSLGLITEQTIAGAISTATHGSGRHSLSHYVAEVRAAAYDAATRKARIHVWRDGAELRAARCAVGCMGVILSVRFRCIPLYDVAESVVDCATLDEVLAGESQFPLQQFYLLPHRWSYLVQRRILVPADRRKRSWWVPLYRAWWLCGIDVGLHLVLKLLAAVLRSAWCVRFFYRHVVSRLLLKNATVIDRGERMLVMEHELFRHLEIEIFVPARHVRRAVALVRTVIETFDGTTTPDDAIAAELERIGLWKELQERRGTFTHHYPITFRRVLPDDALISMSGGDAEPRYAISFITYVEPRDRFLALASFLARSMTRLFGARLHWGKTFPLDGTDVKSVYPALPEFRAVCQQVDPKGVFRTEFTDRVLFDARRGGREDPA
jgi:FAD/FMN-containing dehydrogenase